MCLIHKWSKWVTTEEGQIIENNFINRKVVGNYIIQNKKCKKCGKVKIRTIESHV
jgi:hypothetical protein